MNWLILVAIATVSDSTRIFIDNYTTDVYYKGHLANAQKVFFGYAFIIAALALTLIFGLDFEHLTWSSAWWIFLSGVLGSVAGLAYYKALEIEDSTNLAIFIQLAPVLYLIIGWFFLGDTFSPIQLLAFVIILAAPFLIIASARKRSRKTKIRAIIMAALYVFIAVIGNVIFTEASDPALNITSSMALVFLGKGVSNLIIVYPNRKMINRFREVVKKSHYKVLRPLLANSIVGLIKDFTYRWGLLAAPAVALASVTSDSVQPVVTFLLGVILTLIWPKFGREKLNRKSVLVHLIATVLVVAGIILLQVA